MGAQQQQQRKRPAMSLASGRSGLKMPTCKTLGSDSHAHAGPSGSAARIEETGRLFVRNLPFTAGEPELAELFQEYGELSEVHLVQDRHVPYPDPRCTC